MDILSRTYEIDRKLLAAIRNNVELGKKPSLTTLIKIGHLLNIDAITIDMASLEASLGQNSDFVDQIRTVEMQTTQLILLLRKKFPEYGQKVASEYKSAALLLLKINDRLELIKAYMAASKKIIRQRPPSQKK